MPARRPVALVRGANDVASAVALRLAEAGYAVLLAEGPAPTVTRCGQSFADAAFDGVAMLEGMRCRRVEEAADWLRDGARDIAHCSQPLDALLAALHPEALVDARMRKRAVPEDQRGLAPLMIGLGPGFAAGGNCDLAVETSWGDSLGRVVTTGPTHALSGEPKPIGGWGRERYVYAPVAGVFHTKLNIGDAVGEGQVVAHMMDMADALAKLDAKARHRVYLTSLVGGRFIDAEIAELLGRARLTGWYAAHPERARQGGEPFRWAFISWEKPAS